jgi:hypothetical protein
MSKRLMDLRPETLVLLAIVALSMVSLFIGGMAAGILLARAEPLAGEEHAATTEPQPDMSSESLPPVPRRADR